MRRVMSAGTDFSDFVWPAGQTFPIWEMGKQGPEVDLEPRCLTSQPRTIVPA